MDLTRWHECVPSFPLLCDTRVTGALAYAPWLMVQYARPPKPSAAVVQSHREDGQYCHTNGDDH
jgi:hypothetical protein